MNRCLSAAAMCLLACSLVLAAPAWGADKKGGTRSPATLPPGDRDMGAGADPLRWYVVEKGLELGLGKLPEGRSPGNRTVFVMLRIDPDRHAFCLSMATESGQALSLVEWSRRAGLRAGINASMYLPDMVTSTGYMRSGGSVNNSNMGGRLGAFFVAGPRQDRLPGADIIEKDAPGWRERLDAYGVVAQNYRLISNGRLLWPPDGPLRSIAVVAKDEQGRILFILCQEPLTVGRFASALSAFDLGLGPVMYVEGGAQAGLFVRTDADGPPLPGATAHAVAGGMVHVWKGRQSLLNTRGNPDAPLPNVIGVPMKSPGEALP